MRLLDYCLQCSYIYPPELEGVSSVVFKHSHDLIAHPFHLMGGGGGGGGETRVSSLFPALVNEQIKIFHPPYQKV